MTNRNRQATDLRLGRAGVDAGRAGSATLTAEPLLYTDGGRRITVECPCGATTVGYQNAPDGIRFDDSDMAKVALARHLSEVPDCRCIAPLWRQHFDGARLGEILPAKGRRSMRARPTKRGRWIRRRCPGCGTVRPAALLRRFGSHPSPWAARGVRCPACGQAASRSELDRVDAPPMKPEPGSRR